VKKQVILQPAFPAALWLNVLDCVEEHESMLQVTHGLAVA
jgi:hypothetical protein